MLVEQLGAGQSAFANGLERLFEGGEHLEVASLGETGDSQQVLHPRERPGYTEATAVTHPIENIVQERQDRAVYEGNLLEVKEDRGSASKTGLDVGREFVHVCAVVFAGESEKAGSVADVKSDSQGPLLSLPAGVSQ